VVKVRALEITFSDGTVVPVPQDGTVLLVGPNNAGKSQSLKDLLGLLRDSAYVGRTLSTVDLSKHHEGSVEEWIASSVPRRSTEGLERYFVSGWGEVGASDVLNQWNQPRLAALTGLFVLHADGTSRLSAGDSQASLDFSASIPRIPCSGRT
jgi:hypothetical protein